MGTYKGSTKLKIDSGKYYDLNIKIYEQKGSVIKGTVLFENNQPVVGATAILSYMNYDERNITPISFCFTDQYGNFTFKIENTNLNYIVDVTYNNCIVNKARC